MSSLVQQSQLQKELMDIEFLCLTQNQIAKDFCKVNSSFLDLFQTVTNFDELELQVQENLSRQLAIGERETLQLLYTIDFPEQKFLKLTQEKDFIKLLSQEIIYREAYKVWLRKNYS